MKEWYSLREVAALFHQPQKRIKARCARGDFIYEVTTGSGPTGAVYRISRESILRHLPELEKINNRG